MAASDSVAAVTEGRVSIVVTFESADPGNADMVAGATTTSLIKGTTASRYWIDSIQFIPSGELDRMIVRDKTVGGVEIYDSGLIPTSADLDIAPKVQHTFPLGSWAGPCIDVSECTLGTPANAKLIINFR